MGDNALIQLFLPIINAGLLIDGFDNVLVQQSYQPKQMGVPLQPTVFFQKTHNHRHGWGHAYPKWNKVTGQEQLFEDQWHETHFQFSTLVLQNPLTVSYTAGDLANEVVSILQSESTQQILIASNVGVLRISDIRNPWFTDDRDNFEAMPNFDLILTSLETRISTIPVVSLIVPGIHRE